MNRLAVTEAAPHTARTACRNASDGCASTLNHWLYKYFPGLHYSAIDKNNDESPKAGTSTTQSCSLFPEGTEARYVLILDVVVAFIIILLIKDTKPKPMFVYKTSVWVWHSMVL